MPVINLGQYGPPRESALSGLGSALSEGIRTGAQIAQVKSQVQEAENKKKKEDKDRSEAIATQLSTMEPGKRAQFLLTPQGQETLKAVKKDVPWAFDDQGQFVGLDTETVAKVTKQMAEASLARQKAELGKAIEESGKTGQPLSQQHTALQKFFEMGNENEWSNAVKLAVPELIGNPDPAMQGQIVMKYFKLLKSQGDAAQLPQPEPKANPLGGVKSFFSNFLSTKPALAAPAPPQSSTNEKKSYSNLWS